MGVDCLCPLPQFILNLTLGLESRPGGSESVLLFRRWRFGSQASFEVKPLLPSPILLSVLCHLHTSRPTSRPTVDSHLRLINCSSISTPTGLAAEQGSNTSFTWPSCHQSAPARPSLSQDKLSHQTYSQRKKFTLTRHIANTIGMAKSICVQAKLLVP